MREAEPAPARAVPEGVASERPVPKGIGREVRRRKGSVGRPVPKARFRFPRLRRAAGGCRRKEGADGCEVRRETGGKEAVKKREKACAESRIRKHEKGERNETDGSGI